MPLASTSKTCLSIPGNLSISVNSGAADTACTHQESSGRHGYLAVVNKLKQCPLAAGKHTGEL